MGRDMKSPLLLVAMTLLSVGLNACGSGKDASSATATTVSNAKSTRDHTGAAGDNQDGTSTGDTGRSSILNVAHRASPSERRAITALVKRYYAAAAAEDGAKACSMLYITFAEEIPEDYGTSPPGQPYMRGNTCPAVMVGVFKHFHRQVMTDNARLKVTNVLLLQHHGLAILSFGRTPKRQISVRRERHTWKIEALLASELP